MVSGLFVWKWSLAGRRFIVHAKFAANFTISFIMSELTPNALRNALSESSIQNVVVQVFLASIPEE